MLHVWYIRSSEVLKIKMLDNFVTFEGTPNGSRGKVMRVTLGPSRSFLLSRSVWERMGEPQAVELAFDAVDRNIAMRPCPPDKKNAFRVTPRSSGSHRMIYAGAFLTHFNIHPAHTVLFDEVEFAPDKTMILNLTKVTRVGKGGG